MSFLLDQLIEYVYLLYQQFPSLIRMNKYITTLFITVVCFLSGCTSNSSEPTTQATISYLKVGNTWVYDHRLFNVDGSIDREITDTMRIVGTRDFNGKTYYIFETEFGDPGFQREDNNGLWAYNIARDSEALVFKYPTFIGDSYGKSQGAVSDRGSPFDTIFTETVISSTDSLIYTPAGNFSCYVYKSDGIRQADGALHDRSLAFFSPTSGIIGSNGYYLDPKTGIFYLSRELKVKKILLN